MNNRTRFHGNSNRELVEYLKRTSSIKSDYVFNLMCSVDRKNFTTLSKDAYIDAPHKIFRDKTISSPHMHARTLELFADKLKSGKRALDIGSGSGYLTTCFALALGERGFVAGIECIPELKQMAKDILIRHHPELCQYPRRVKFHVGDGRLGYSLGGPYDIIHVGAADLNVPQILIDQLALGGRLVMPIGPPGSIQSLVQIDKLLDGRIERKDGILSVIYGCLSDVSQSIILNINKTSMAINSPTLNTVNKTSMISLEAVTKNLDQQKKKTEENFEQLNREIENIRRSIELARERKDCDDLKENVEFQNRELRKEIVKLNEKDDGTTAKILQITQDISTLKVSTGEMSAQIINVIKELDTIKQQNDKLTTIENRWQAIENKIGNLENVMGKGISESSLSESIISSQVHMINVVDKTVKMQEILMADNEIEHKNRDEYWEEMKRKIESVEINSQNLKINLEKILENIESLDKKFESHCKIEKENEKLELEKRQNQKNVLHNQVLELSNLSDRMNRMLMQHNSTPEN